MIKYNACDLSRLIETTYGKEFNVPYEIMEDQKLYEVPSVSVMESDEDKQWVTDRIAVWKNKNGCGDHEDLEALMCDLCARKLLEVGDYLLEFDD